MLSPSLDTRPDTTLARPMPAPPAAKPRDHGLDLLAQKLSVVRKLVHAGDRLYQAGQRFACLYVLRSGMSKMVHMSPDGRDQVVALHFKGDWLGLDGIARGSYGCDAVAMDTGEVWAVRYDALIDASMRCPALLTLLHEAMSREMSRDRDALLSLNTLCADARVANFLRYWAQSQADRGLRIDQIRLRMTRAEIGNFLGMTLESVSRAMSRLERDQLIRFPADGGRRAVEIPALDALDRFVERTLTSHSPRS